MSALPPKADLLGRHEKGLLLTQSGHHLWLNISEEEFDRLGDYTSALETRVAEMPVHTVEGVAVKLRRLRANYYDNSIWTEDWVETSITALERLAGGAA